MSDQLDRPLSTEHNEIRIFGPPGVGKTTYMSRQIGLAAERFGPTNVLVTSFTRAAAAELVGRNLPIPRQSVGTLHAHCYHALDRPQIAEEHVKEWNEERPGEALSESSNNMDEGAADQYYERPGDDKMAAMNLYRARMVPREIWPESIRSFAQRWDEWKRARGCVDYTDLLEMALADVRIAPGDPAVIFADEVQDFNALQLTLVRKWGNYAEYLCLAADDDQTIFSFTGATPTAFLHPDIPVENKRFQRQSWRVPRAVHAVATKWIEKVEVREKKEYLPRDADGEVRVAPSCHWQAPDDLLRDAEQYIAEGKSVMFLTACAYMLEPLKLSMRARGIPFHNPYRKSRGDWNPLGGGGVSTASRLLAFLRPREDVWFDQAREWNVEELRKWTDLIKGEGILRHGSKAMLTALDATAPVTLDVLDRLLEPAALDELIALLSERKIADCLDWIERRALKAKERALKYPATVLRNCGPVALFETPQIVIGTIHSVKGGQSDVVYLFPDLSRPGFLEWQKTGECHDSIIRQWYVGMTRARETLVMCAPATSLFVEVH